MPPRTRSRSKSSSPRKRLDATAFASDRARSRSRSPATTTGTSTSTSTPPPPTDHHRNDDTNNHNNHHHNSPRNKSRNRFAPVVARRRFSLLLVVLALVGGGLGCWWWCRRTTTTSTTSDTGTLTGSDGDTTAANLARAIEESRLLQRITAALQEGGSLLSDALLPDLHRRRQHGEDGHEGKEDGHDGESHGGESHDGSGQVEENTTATNSAPRRPFFDLFELRNGTLLEMIRSFRVGGDGGDDPATTADPTAHTTTHPYPIADKQQPGLMLAARGVRHKYPVFLVPGITSTNLESWARGGCSDLFFRKKIWGDLLAGILLDIQCWITNLLLDPNHGMDPPNAKVRAAQGIDAADYFVPGYWVWAKMIENLASIGYDTNNLHLAAYDWRLSPGNMERRDRYFSKLKMNLELSKRVHGEKAVIVTHSMGGNVLHYFLQWVESPSLGHHSTDWVDQHIHAIVSIATPFLGVPKSIPSILSGEMRDTAQMGWAMTNLLERFLQRRQRAALFRSWGAISSMLPKGGDAVWGNATWAPDMPSTYDGGTSFGQLLSFASSSLSSSSAATTTTTTTATTTPTPAPPPTSTTEPAGPLMQNVTADTLLPFLFDATESLYRKRVQAEFSFGIDLSKRRFSTKRSRTTSTAGTSAVTTTSTAIATTAGALAQEDPRQWTNVLESALPLAPTMKFYCFYGHGKMTERSYFYLSAQDAGDVGAGGERNENGSNTTPTRWHMDTSIHDPPRNLHSGVQDVMGDGTVPLLSLGYMCRSGWSHGDSSSSSVSSVPPSSTVPPSPSVLASSPPVSRGAFYGEQLNPARIPIVTREYVHDPVSIVQDIRGGPKSADHVDILGNAEMTRDILLIVSGEADKLPLADNIVSNIDEISARVVL